MAHKSKKVLNLKWQEDSQYISEHLIVKCKHEFCNNQPQFTRIYHNLLQFTIIHSRNCNLFHSIEVGYATLKVKSLSMNYITLMIKFMIFLSIQSSHMDSNLHERGIKEEKPLRPPRWIDIVFRFWTYRFHIDDDSDLIIALLSIIFLSKAWNCKLLMKRNLRKF